MIVSRKVATFVSIAGLLIAACGGSATPPPSAAEQSSAPTAAASSCVVGVSWNNFQQPRWAAHDKPAIQQTVEAAGGKYIDKDANLSNEQQATDIEHDDLAGRQGPDHPRPGHEGRPAVDRQGQAGRHPGHRV